LIADSKSYFLICIFEQKQRMIYLAPIQGFTDYIYRSAYSAVFPGIDTFFIPYISLKNGQVLNKYKREVLQKNNPQNNVIPQVLAKNSDEFLSLSSLLKEIGYTEINLNLGCPYPMVTKRGKGAGLLQYPKKIEEMLAGFFEKTDLKLSVKLRAGLTSPTETEQIIPVLNRFPLTEVIFHPRIASQLYKGKIYNGAFRFAAENLNHKLVYNGDIFSVQDFENHKKEFYETETMMLGRGVLMNPFLPAEINKQQFTEDERIEKLKEFHRQVFDGYTEAMDNWGNVMNKMVQFWSYFSFGFPNQKKIFKTIKKLKTLNDYDEAVRKAFYSLYEKQNSK
jgi:tRNA-dihydrouridine synthase